MAEPRWRGPRATLSLVLTGLAVLLALGTWQIERRAWKAELIATMTARLAMPPALLSEVLRAGGAPASDADFRPVRATGTFLHDKEMYLAARSYRGQLGYHVVTPLLLEGSLDGAAVLVDRGWVPTDRQAPADRAAGQVSGTVTVEGILRIPAPPGTFTPDNRPDRNLWYWPDLAAMGAHAGLARVAPGLIAAGATANPGGLPIGGQTRLNLPNNHLQYAITWYALAVVLLVIYLVSRRRRVAGPPSRS